MAEAGTWPSIQERGLLSTEALLDVLGGEPGERVAISNSRRPQQREHRGIVIRDQKPMNHNLVSCLKPANILPQQWFSFLNRKVFFWATALRLATFHNAYGKRRQLFIEIPTERMLDSHRFRISLCHMNSGATRMPDHFRSFETFQPVASFPFSTRRKVAEFTVDYEVQNIADLARRAYESGGDQAAVLLHSK